MLKPCDIEAKLQQVDLLVAQGHPIAEATSRIGVSPAAYSYWLTQHGGRVGVPLDRLEHLYSENCRLRRLVARLNVELEALKSRPRLDLFAKALNTRA